MQLRSFGKTNWQVSVIGFGAWAIGGNWGNQKDDESIAALNKALDLGVNFIDTAQGYGDGRSEEIIGKVLKERHLAGGGKSIKIATKIPPLMPGHWPPLAYEDIESRYPAKYLREAVETSLKRLKAETIDLMQLHTWTRAWNKNPTALHTLQELKKEGKIAAIGISTPEQDQNSLIDLIKNGLIDSAQVIYNIFEQEPAAELLDAAREHGAGIIVRCVLDEGALTGKFNKQTTFGPGDFRGIYFKGFRLGEVVERVEAIREEVKKYPQENAENMASVAVRFALKHPGVSTVITGIRTLSQAEQNTAVGDQLPLPAGLYKALQEHAWRRYFWEKF